MTDSAKHTFADLPKPFSSTVHVDICGLTDRGHVRENNEDHYLIIRAARALETISSSLPMNSPDRFEETGYGFVVADGVGGHAAGEIASREAIFGLLSLALHTPDWQFKWGFRETNTVKWRMQDRFRRVNAALVQMATAQAALSGMCTTMTAALSHGQNLIIGHIGDSRAYLMRRGKLQRITRDHTLAETFSGVGDKRLNDRLDPLGNVLIQALGGSESECTPDIDDYLLNDGDQLLVCTDGLTDMVEDLEIETVLLKAKSAQAACRSLVDLALTNGGRDNVTVIVARYSFPQP